MFKTYPKTDEEDARNPGYQDIFSFRCPTAKTGRNTQKGNCGSTGNHLKGTQDPEENQSNGYQSLIRHQGDHKTRF